MNKAWKQMERDIAKKFGTRRSGYEQSKKKKITSSDTFHPRLYIECKRRKRINLSSVWSQVTEGAKRERKIPLLVWKHPDMTHSLLICRMRDIKKIAKELV